MVTLLAVAVRAFGVEARRPASLTAIGSFSVLSNHRAPSPPFSTSAVPDAGWSEKIQFDFEPMPFTYGPSSRLSRGGRLYDSKIVYEFERDFSQVALLRLNRSRHDCHAAKVGMLFEMIRALARLTNRHWGSNQCRLVWQRRIEILE